VEFITVSHYSSAATGEIDPHFFVSIKIPIDFDLDLSSSPVPQMEVQGRVSSKRPREDKTKRFIKDKKIMSKTNFFFPKRNTFYVNI
jgi:hypothetical protein